MKHIFGVAVVTSNFLLLFNSEQIKATNVSRHFILISDPINVVTQLLLLLLLPLLKLKLDINMKCKPQVFFNTNTRYKNENSQHFTSIQVMLKVLLAAGSWSHQSGACW